MKRAAAIVALLLLVACNSGPRTSTQQRNANEVPPAPMRAVGDPKTASDHGWLIGITTSKMDKTPEALLSKVAEDKGGVLVVRCFRSRTEVLVATSDVVDNGSVRLKFDDESPRRQNWGEATSHDALFSRDPIPLARKLATTRTLLFEYQPFQKSPATVEFNLAGLADHLDAVATACNWAKIDQAKAEAARNAKAAAELNRVREVKIRGTLAKYVEPCHEAWLRDKGRWCWYDLNDSFFKDGGSPKETKEAALDDAVYMAKSGRVFVKQLAEIDRELKP